MNRIVLVGNPNVGKSVIFNALTGKYVVVSNYPGTTVEISKGQGKFDGKEIEVIDTPGINSIVALSEDEEVTREILLKGGVGAIIQVADSKNLKRSLLLTLELLELKIPIVLNLNMKDEARERGIVVDVKKLSKKLGIDVVETVATTGEGIARLREAIQRPKTSTLKIDTEVVYGLPKNEEMIRLLKIRTKRVDILLKDVVSNSKLIKKQISEKIASLTTRPITGIPILLLTLILMYLFVGKFAAGYAVDFFEEKLFGDILNPFIIQLADKFIKFAFLKELLVGEYGIITMALTYSLAIIFPIVTAFFIFFGILEDSGYLPRLSVLSDKVFKTIGLNGRAILPMVLGLGCGTMATLTTRILDTKKERILVTLLLTLAVPCSAQLGVIMGMLGNMSITALLIWLSVILSVMIIVGFGASKLVRGDKPTFIQELPPIRMPQIKNIISKTLSRLKWYLKEAVPLFVLGTIMLFIFDKIGVLAWIENVMKPIVVGLLGLPKEATEAFIIGFLRRDYGAAGLYTLSKEGIINNTQVLVSLVVVTLFVPCVAQFFVTIKERGLKVALVIGVLVFTIAFLIGGMLNFVLRYLMEQGIFAL